MPAASCTSHAPFSSSALRPAPVPALFFHAEPGWGEGPTPGAPGRPAAQRGLPAPGALTPSRSAPTCRRPWPAVLRGRRDEPGWRAGGAVGSGPRQRARGPAAGCPVRSGSAAPRWESEPGAPRVAAAYRRRSLCSGPAVRDNVEQPGRRVAPRSPRSLPFSHSPSSSLSPALPVMSARGGGARVNPLAAPARRPRPPRPPPGRAHLPARGRGGARARAGGRAGPLAGAMPLRPPCGAAQSPSAGRPALSPTKGGSDP